MFLVLCIFDCILQSASSWVIDQGRGRSQRFYPSALFFPKTLMTPDARRSRAFLED